MEEHGLDREAAQVRHDVVVCLDTMDAVLRDLKLETACGLEMFEYVL